MLLSAANITLRLFRSSTTSAHASRVQASITHTRLERPGAHEQVLAQVVAVQVAQLPGPGLDEALGLLHGLGHLVQAVALADGVDGGGRWGVRLQHRLEYRIDLVAVGTGAPEFEHLLLDQGRWCAGSSTGVPACGRAAVAGAGVVVLGEGLLTPWARFLDEAKLGVALGLDLFDSRTTNRHFWTGSIGGHCYCRASSPPDWLVLQPILSANYLTSTGMTVTVGAGTT